ncbi:MAG: hypothetical protein IPK26_30920 [Planctomycetes bacterium]|nr:hypothetical protein [Planctomycetota bacterium]
MHRLVPIAVLSMLAAAPAQRALLDTLPADLSTSGLSGAFEGSFRELPLRGAGKLTAIGAFADTAWVARGDHWYRHDLSSWELLAEVPAAVAVVDFAADARFLHGLGRDGRITLIDPRAGRPVREHDRIDYGENPPEFLGITTAGDGFVLLDNKRAAWRVDGKLQRGERIVELGARADAAAWLGCREGMLITGGHRSVQEIDARTGATERFLQIALTSQQAGDVAGAELLIGGSENGDTVLRAFTPWPERWRTTVDVRRRGQEGLTWSVGPLALTDDAGLCDALQVIRRRTPESRTMAGIVVPMPLILRVRDGVTVGDLARTWDLALAAGWQDVRVAGLADWVARQRSR